jgi:hypothetical protein
MRFSKILTEIVRAYRMHATHQTWTQNFGWEKIKGWTTQRKVEDDGVKIK